MPKLAHKVAIVTGASKGIGAGIARQMAIEGATVVVNYASSKQDADKVVAEIFHHGGTAIAVQADMSKQADVERLFAETMKAYGRIDILVNNAGVYEFKPIETFTEENFHRLFNLNVLGVVFAIQQAVKHFGSDGGVILNISSVASKMTPTNGAVYSASKAAVDALTTSLAKELGPRKIRVNAINPGMIETEGVHSAGFDKGDFRQEIESKTPLGRIGQPGDVAPAAVFLCSDDAAWITGETWFVSGGLGL